MKNIEFTKLFFFFLKILGIIVLTSCQTLATYTLSDEKLVATVLEPGESVDSGNIVFTEKGTSFLSKIYWKLKKTNPSINEKTIQIEGHRTYSSDKGTIRTTSADSTINTLMGIEQHDYEWTGSLTYDGKELPIWYHFWVAGSSRGMKEYELTLNYCGGKKPTFKDKLKFLIKQTKIFNTKTRGIKIYLPQANKIF